METLQGLRPIQRGTVLHDPDQAEQGEETNSLLVLDYNAGNHMAIVADLEHRARNTGSLVAVPIRIDGGAGPTSALIHRIRSVDTSQRQFTPTATVNAEDTQRAIGRLIRMIED